MGDTAAERTRVLVSGRVQNVYFRAACRAEAAKAGLGGFVRNLADGRVEAVFEGDPAKVAVMAEWCRSGPPGARVDSVELVAEEPRGEREFRVC